MAVDSQSRGSEPVRALPANCAVFRPCRALREGMVPLIPDELCTCGRGVLSCSSAVSFRRLPGQLTSRMMPSCVRLLNKLAGMGPSNLVGVCWSQCRLGSEVLAEAGKGAHSLFASSSRVRELSCASSAASVPRSCEGRRVSALPACERRPSHR